MKATSVFSCKRIAGGRRGQALVEFAIGTLVLLMLVFGVIEIARIFLVYTTITDAARQGVRYAITHGTPPAGPTTTGTATNTDVGNMQTAVQTVVKSFLAPGTVNINAGGLTVTTTFPNKSCAGATSGSLCSGTTPGNLVQVTVSYPYDLLISYYPINVTLAGTSEGVITW
jgi:Flp pilus assembly protein TadG